MAVSLTSVSPSKAPVRYIITITGSGFGATKNDNTVTINSTSATVKEVSSSYITVQIPSSLTAGTYDITVTNTTDNTSDTLTSALEVADLTADEKKYVAMFFGKYDSTNGYYYVSSKEEIPYTNGQGSKITNCKTQKCGTTYSIIDLIASDLLNPDDLAAGPYGHKRMLEGTTNERKFERFDALWAMTNSGLSDYGSVTYTYTPPSSFTLTLSKTSPQQGETIEIKSTGITPNGSVTIGATSVTIDFVTLGVCKITIPSTFTPGSYTLTYTNEVGNSSSTSITIKERTPAAYKTIEVVSGLTGSITKVDFEDAVGISKSNKFTINTKGDLDIEVKQYCILKVTNPTGTTKEYKSTEKTVSAGGTSSFTITIPSTDNSKKGQYKWTLTLYDKIVVDSKIRDETDVDTEKGEYWVSDKPIILVKKTLDSWPDRITLGKSYDFPIYIKNLSNASATLYTELLAVKTTLPTGDPCDYTCGSNVWNCFLFKSSSVSVGAGQEYKFIISWTIDRKTELGDYYMCASLYKV